MIIPDFRSFLRNRVVWNLGNGVLAHSAKGSTWEEHKYIKRKNGTYYYPDSYEGGRHLPDGESSDSQDEDSSAQDESFELDESDIEKLANEVIRGNFGSGQERRDLLGEHYQEIQDRVNEILLGPAGFRKVSSAKKETTEETPKEKEDTKETAKTAGLDMERILSVYRKKKEK